MDSDRRKIGRMKALDLAHPREWRVKEAEEWRQDVYGAANGQGASEVAKNDGDK
jgi:hypothetical protein